MMNGYLLNPKFSFAIEALEEFMLLKQWMVRRLFAFSGVYTKYPVSEMDSCFLFEFTVRFFVLQFLNSGNQKKMGKQQKLLQLTD